MTTSLLENDAKLAELILYVAKKSQEDRRFGATKLNKILFYSDFLAFARHGRAITQQIYQRLPQGPAPRRLLPVRDLLRQADAIAIQENGIVPGRVQHRVIALRDPNLSLFSAEEIALVDFVIEELRPLNAEQVSELSHLFLGWKAARDGEDIPYETVYLDSRDLTQDERDYALELRASCE